MSMTADPDQTNISTATIRDGPRVAIIGIYGISGSGKSYLLKGLEESLGYEGFKYYGGATEIASLVQGDLQYFQQLDQVAKEHLRQLAVCKIRDECVARGKAGIVAGHSMLWSDVTRSPLTICTKADLRSFTHIVYLDADVDVVAQRCRNASNKQRGVLSTRELRTWQEAEKTFLRDACYTNGILYTALSAQHANASYVAALLSKFHRYSEKDNLLQVEKRLHNIMALRASPATTMLVLDADRTLAAIDTGEAIWKHDDERFEAKSSPLRAIFASPLNYSHRAFQQAALLHHECYSPDTYDALCERIALKVDLYPEMASLLHQVLGKEHSGAIVVTCGLQLLWEKILSRHGFSAVSVVGAGRLDDVVVDGEVKAAMVQLLRQSYGVRVTAFGDSPLDLQMLGRADRAVIVVGDERNRSRRMDLELGLAIHDGMLKAQQAVLSPGAPPRLNTRILPTVSLADPKFVHDVLDRRSQKTELRVIHTTNRGAAKLLMTSMRDASMSGPALRYAHQSTGWYLATEILPDVLGVEEYAIPHVQGHATSGFRVKNECNILIVAVMRGGEPMALGVNAALPSAPLLHAKHPQDIPKAYLEQTSTVILVDSVVNSGNTMVEFVRQIHEHSGTVAIVMLGGVVQSESIRRLEKLCDCLEHPQLTLVCLRISQNKYKGQGGTDTGNRLYNTVNLS